MTLGEKIKKARLDKKMTQSELCENRITRNMLSSIECNKAMPSLDTLTFLADALSLPLSYLLSEEDDLFAYKKRSKMDEIKSEYANKNYKKCIEIINTLDGADDGISYILSYCYFEVGRQFVLNGALRSGFKNLQLAKSCCETTIYDTSKIEALLLIYTALASNIQSPLLEFETKEFEKALDAFDFEFYKYIMQDYSYPYKNPIFDAHTKAKGLLKSRRYSEAISLLKQIESEKTPETYNSHVMFSVYNDLEHCYKQIADFENAYRYASKKISLMEAFKK